MDSSFLYIFLGLFVGTLGTLIGAGGGFILMPIFFFLFPHSTTDYLTAISLAVVFFNSASGSIAYAIDRQIDYRPGIIFSLAAFPGAIIGAIASQYLSRSFFDPLFGTLLFLMAVYLFWKPERKLEPTSKDKYNLKLGAALSTGVGLVSSLLGIGGGIVHVPILVHLLRFPVHRATATSHFILAILSFTAVLTHYIQGSYDANALQLCFYLIPGAILGAQFGAKLSKRVHGKIIIRALAIALASVGIRLLVKALSFQ